MSSYVKLIVQAAIELDGNYYTFGSASRPRFIAASGEKTEKVVTIAASSTEELWDATKSTTSSFSFLWIQCTRDVTLELIVDDDNSVGEIAFTVELTGTDASNEYGVPFLLTSDVSYAGNTAGFNGTADKIERIQAKNADASDSTQVLFLALS